MNREELIAFNTNHLVLILSGDSRVVGRREIFKKQVHLINACLDYSLDEDVFYKQRKGEEISKIALDNMLLIGERYKSGDPYIQNLIKELKEFKGDDFNGGVFIEVLEHEIGIAIKKANEAENGTNHN